MKHIAPMLCFAVVLLGQPVSARTAVQEHFEDIRQDPVAMRSFLSRFPKGADLHNHLDGAVYAENLLLWAAQDGKCIDLNSHTITPPPCNQAQRRPAVADILYNDAIVNPIIDQFSTRNYPIRSVSGHNQFFSTFGRFIPATFGREGSMLAEVSVRAARQNILHLELMQSLGMHAARQLAAQSPHINKQTSIETLLALPAFQQVVQQAIRATDRAEQQWHKELQCADTNPQPACALSVRYLSQVIRTVPPQQVLVQTLLAFALVQQDPRYVGLNFVAPEDHPITLRDHLWQMQTIGKIARHFPAARGKVSLHAGELAMGLVPPEHLGTHIRQAIEIAGARRIGHGVDIAYDADPQQLMRQMAQQGILVEINLTSNATILGVEGDRHPFQTYRSAGVPLALSTDDEGVSRIDLTHEYERAVRTYGLDYADLKQLSRNALAHSFLPGQSLFADNRTAQIVPECAQSKPQHPAPDKHCRRYLASSEKARLQWQLEARLATFESAF